MTVIDATKQFQCNHEFIGIAGGFVCRLCEHFRLELPLQVKKSDKKLYFFPSVKASGQ